jgi:hypothetical protein
MDRVVRSQNVERYRRLLESVTEKSKRQTILNLLGEERQKQKDASAFAELSCSCVRANCNSPAKHPVGHLVPNSTLKVLNRTAR